VSDRRVEAIKLARVLGLRPDELADLALDAGGLRALRDAASAALFDATGPTLRRVARACKLIPNPMAARLGQSVFGPLLCARIVGLLAPDHGLDLALRMPDRFLADTSVELDPRRAAPLLAALPSDRIVAVAGLLVTRGDHLTLARFVEYLSTETIAAVIASIEDELVLLHIATFIDSPSRLAELVGLIPLERLRAMIAAAGAAPGELWLEALALANQLDRAWQRTIGDLAAELDPSVLDAMVATARAADAWDAVLPVVVAMSEPGQQRFLALPSVADDAVLEGLAGAADRLDMWPAILGLALRMPPALHARLAAKLAQLPAAVTDLGNRLGA